MSNTVLGIVDTLTYMWNIRKCAEDYRERKRKLNGKKSERDSWLRKQSED